MEKIIRVPSAGSWKLTMGIIGTIFISIILSAIGACQSLAPLFFVGIVGKYMKNKLLKIGLKKTMLKIIFSKVFEIITMYPYFRVEFL